MNYPSLQVDLLLAAIALVGLAAYHYVLGNPPVKRRELFDKEQPYIRHTPRPTWFSGFRYKQHGIEKEALLDTPIYLDYEAEQFLGQFKGIDGTSWHSTDKELTAYDFSVYLQLLPGGRLEQEELSRQISIIDLEPIITVSADAATTIQSS